MALNPDYYDATSLMAFYLEPRWHGSEQAALSFARSCVTSQTWGGEVPLTLFNTHCSLAAYLKKKEDLATAGRVEGCPSQFRELLSTKPKANRMAP